MHYYMMNDTQGTREKLKKLVLPARLQRPRGAAPGGGGGGAAQLGGGPSQVGGRVAHGWQALAAPLAGRADAALPARRPRAA